VPRPVDPPRHPSAAELRPLATQQPAIRTRLHDQGLLLNSQGNGGLNRGHHRLADRFRRRIRSPCSVLPRPTNDSFRVHPYFCGWYLERLPDTCLRNVPEPIVASLAATVLRPSLTHPSYAGAG